MTPRRSRDVPLSGGCSRALWEHGDPDPEPVLVFHGAPACGAGFGSTRPERPAT